MEALNAGIGAGELLKEVVELAVQLAVVGLERGQGVLHPVVRGPAAMEFLLIADRQRAIVIELDPEAADLAIPLIADAGKLFDLRRLVMRHLDEFRQHLPHRRRARHQQVELDGPVRDLGEFGLQLVGLVADRGSSTDRFHASSNT